MGAISIVFHIEISDKAAGVRVGWLAFIDINDWPELVESKHFPGALVVEFHPTHILRMTESKKTVIWSF